MVSIERNFDALEGIDEYGLTEKPYFT